MHGRAAQDRRFHAARGQDRAVQGNALRAAARPHPERPQAPAEMGEAAAVRPHFRWTAGDGCAARGALRLRNRRRAGLSAPRQSDPHARSQPAGVSGGVQLIERPRARPRPDRMPMKPDVAQMLAQGWVEQRAGNIEQAAKLCEQALTADPENPDGHHLLGVIAHGLGHADVALHHLGRALTGKPQDAAVHAAIGGGCRGARTRHPQDAAGPAAIGGVYRGLRRPADARESLVTALRLDPDSAGTRNDLGIVLAERGLLAEALPHFEAAVALDPKLAQAHSNLARVLGGLDRLDDAIASYREAPQVDPGYVNARNNIGIELTRLACYDEALAELDEALRLDPENAAAHANRAVLLLRLGRFAEGFAEYEWRWRTQPPKSPPRDFAQPPWAGEDLRAATLMLHAEQGFGDTLQFCRYVPVVARRCAKVYLEVPRPLLRLLRHSLAGENLEVIPRLADFPATQALPRTDYHCPLLSLPRVLGTTVDDVPAAVPYLAADATQAAAWSQRLRELPGRKVGLVWAGLPQYADDAHRSLPLAQLAPLGGVVGVTFISL